MLDAVLANEPVAPLQPRPIKGMRLAVPTTIALDDLDEEVAKTFERALETLSRQGALIERIEVPEFLDVGVDERQGRVCRRGKLCLAPLSDRQQGRRLRSPGVASASCAAKASAPPIISTCSMRAARSLRGPEARIAPYDALVMPTTANTPPASPISPTTRPSPRKTCASLRNCTLINMIDGCAISLPAHREGEVPVGLMLAAAGGSDRRIFELAAGMESVIRV